jgi:transcriptional regulator with XRE-family HTH domain
MFILSEMLKEARKEAKMTQEQLAEKAGTKIS